ncbi:hypothetical protein ACN6LI_006359 [Streptomyces violaceoruber]
MVSVELDHVPVADLAESRFVRRARALAALEAAKWSSGRWAHCRPRAPF